MKRAGLVVATLICLSAIAPISAFGQKLSLESESKRFDIFEIQSSEELYGPEHISKKPGHYTREDWQEAIDETWGWGLPKAQKLSIFDTFWGRIDEEYACFIDHPDYYPGFWDDLRNLYRTEIETGDQTYGVSRGRFAAIMNYLAMALKDSHTWVKDLLVNTQTSLEPGVPLLVVGAYGENGHFGAGLTPLPDSSLLIYKTVQDHPLALEPGDIVLGYDGIPWKELYQELIEAQLPLYHVLGYFWGSSESAYTHSFLKAAGMNWHLFDALDIVKYGTDDTLHLSIEPLIGQDMQLWCTEQMEIPGVPMPDYNAGGRVTFGIIDGTQIGYIYVFGWNGNIEEPFFNAVNTLMNDYETTGLILDFRGAFGGWDHPANPGFKLLFNTREPLYKNDIRCSPNNHLFLCPSTIDYGNNIYGSPDSYYDKPIAVLTGPQALSAADYNALAVKLHPTTRFFGKPTCGAFNFPYSLSLGSGWLSRYAELNSCLVSDPGNYLTRWEFEVDEAIWLTPDDVAQGYDTVVESAKSWINSLQDTQPDIACDPTSFNISLEAGEVITQELKIHNYGNRHIFYSLTPVIDDQLPGLSPKNPADSL